MKSIYTSTWRHGKIKSESLVVDISSTVSWGSCCLVVDSNKSSVVVRNGIGVFRSSCLIVASVDSSRARNVDSSDIATVIEFSVEWWDVGFNSMCFFSEVDAVDISLAQVVASSGEEVVNNSVVNIDVGKGLFFSLHSSSIHSSNHLHWASVVHS